MTEKLYYQDAYMKSFTAKVQECREGKKGWEIVLDRTAFYPEGGGQPGDSGYLGNTRVFDTHEKDGAVLHYCDQPVAVGEEIEGRIDFERRFDFMQQHSGEHIVSGIIHKRFGCDNVGFHMGAETVTIDFNCPISAGELEEIELESNRVIWENRPFKVLWPDAQELAKLPYRSKKALSGAVRIVECPGADMCACCGTHVSRAGEIGIIKLLSVHPFREGVRIEMLSGIRAYRHFCLVNRQNSAVSALLSAKIDATAAAVERLQQELAETSYRLVGLENRLFEDMAERYAGEEDALIFEEGLSSDGVRRLADSVMGRCGGLVAVFSGSDGQGYKYALCKAGGDNRSLVKEMNTALCGRGGGKPHFAQGSLQCSREEIESFFGRV